MRRTSRGQRAANWWSAFQLMSIYAAAGRLGSKQLAGIRRDYDRAMGERVFGYSEEGGFAGFGKSQADTTRPMTQAMKQFLDHELLEDKIPDKFEDVGAFKKFGHDFSRVKVHTGGAAAGSADALEALAYTVGEHVVFANGRYPPGTAAGNELLAHEVTHVVQQEG